MVVITHPVGLAGPMVDTTVPLDPKTCITIMDTTQEATMVIPTTKQVIALHQEEEGEMQNLGQKSRMQGTIRMATIILEAHQHTIVTTTTIVPGI